MSIISALNKATQQKLKSFPTLPQVQRLQVLKTCHFLYGRPFLQALTEIETNLSSKQEVRAGDLVVCEGEVFAVAANEVLFYRHGNGPREVQCTCEAVWARKCGELMSPCQVCKHEMLYMLWKYCFRGENGGRIGDNIDELMEILKKVKD